MIQRKQSVYLALLGIICLLLILLDPSYVSGTVLIDGNLTPQFEFSNNNTTVFSEPVTLISRTNSMYAFILCSSLAILSIFLFKKRELQIRLTAFNFLFISLAIFYLVYEWYKMNHMTDVQITSYNFHLSIVLPFVLPLINFLALKGIRKDIELVASADRLR
ncbi:MAG: DUF4293 domain-containing protein [Bacteroidia bacterium]